MNTKRYYSLSEYNLKQFGGKVYKLAFDIGCTCPNRDGSKSVDGCIFCSGKGSGEHSVKDIDSAIAKLGDKACGRYIAYFQSFSNTYCEVEYLKKHVDAALSDGRIVGLAIATRADCISDEMLDYLDEINRVTHLVVELGLQTANDRIADMHNRQHTFGEFEICVERLKGRNIRICVHIIDGLMGETTEDMLNTAREAARLRPHSVKIHTLHVLKNTRLADYYSDGKVNIMTREKYVEIVSRQLTLLPPDTVIERLTGDGERNSLIEPLWTLSKRKVLNEIDKYLAANDMRQGDRYAKYNRYD